MTTKHICACIQGFAIGSCSGSLTGTEVFSKWQQCWGVVGNPQGVNLAHKDLLRLQGGQERQQSVSRPCKRAAYQVRSGETL